MGGRGVQIPIELFDVLSVVSLLVGKAEESFLQYRIAPVPEREGETEPLAIVA
jgi:hypothetical protein